MVGLSIVLATLVAQQERAVQTRDVSEHVQVVRRLTERLLQSGFPDLAGWQLIRRSLPKNALMFDPLEVYAWIDPSGLDDRAYTLKGMVYSGSVAGEPVRIDDLVREREEVTMFAGGTFTVTGVGNALLAIMSAGRPDLVERIIRRDRIFRSTLDGFEKGLLLSLIVPIYNTSVHLYTQGREAQARASLEPALRWLLQTVPAVPEISQESRNNSIEVLYKRSFILAAEIRRGSRDKDDFLFDPEVADELTGQRKIDYLIGHLDEAVAIVAIPGGAIFSLSRIVRLLEAEGNAAIPSLQRTIDSDPRLTKVTYSRIDGQVIYIYSVADVARRVLRSIEGGRSFNSHKQDSAIRGLGGARHETLGAKR